MDLQRIEIPVLILRDPRVEDSAKLLYGILLSKSREFGYCVTTNKELAIFLNLSIKRVSFLLGKLEKLGYLHRELTRDYETNEVMERRLYPIRIGEYCPPAALRCSGHLGRHCEGNYHHPAPAGGRSGSAAARPGGANLLCTL